MRVEYIRCSALLSVIPGPITMSAVTGTLIDATSPKCIARAATEQSTTVIPTVTQPNPKMLTLASAVPAPMAVPRIWPKPSRVDLCSEIRTVKLATIAATNPPFLKAKSPTCHDTAAAAAVTNTC